MRNGIISEALKQAKLTPRQIYIMGLHLEGWRNREIAEELGCSRQAVGKALQASMASVPPDVMLAELARVREEVGL